MRGSVELSPFMCTVTSSINQLIYMVSTTYNTNLETVEKKREILKLFVCVFFWFN